MQQRFSATDWLFAVVLWAAAILAALIWFSPDPHLRGPLTGLLSSLVAAAILVNLYRFWRACAGLRKRDQP